eukprot:Transcript_9483.p4 GENE.Transcript_9483~~Transcript_9483.p4  ORF type:complete len:160 (-),score=71.23 Transcript_9483:32-511(-)
MIMPSDDTLSSMITALWKAIKDKKHHDGVCFKSNTERQTVGCGCVLNGKACVKKVGVELDQRQLECLFARGSACSKLLLPVLKSKTPADLARMLAFELAALEARARAPSAGAGAGAPKRPRPSPTPAQGGGGAAGPSSDAAGGAAEADDDAWCVVCMDR